MGTNKPHQFLCHITCAEWPMWWLIKHPMPDIYTKDMIQFSDQKCIFNTIVIWITTKKMVADHTNHWKSERRVTNSLYKCLNITLPKEERRGKPVAIFFVHTNLGWQTFIQSFSCLEKYYFFLLNIFSKPSQSSLT